MSDAIAGVSPSPTVRKGKPHSRMNAVPENGVVKCDQNARRVAGCAHDSVNPWRRSADEVTACMAPVFVSTLMSAFRPGGRLRMTAKVSTVKSTPSPARLPKAIVQLVACSSAAMGRIAKSCPVCPTMPVSCTMKGACRSGNQTATTRSTLGKIAASPAPSSMRARIAVPTLGANAITSWPTAMRNMPIVMIGRAPKRSSRMPTGICIAP